MGAGRFRPENRPGAMHGDRNIVRELHYGADPSSLYVRLDFEREPSDVAVALRTTEATVQLSHHPAVKSAMGKIFEARIPRDLLGGPKEQPGAFQVVLQKDNATVERIPADGWIELINFES